MATSRRHLDNIANHSRATAAGKKFAQGGIAKGTRLALPVSTAMRYAIRLDKLTRQMGAETLAALTAWAKHGDVQDYFAEFAGRSAIDISPASQARILTNKLKDRFDQLFAMEAKPAADDMVDKADDESEAATGRSLRSLSEDITLNPSTAFVDEFAKATVAENVRLIKSIPSEYFDKVQGSILRSITGGSADVLTELTDMVERQNGEAERRAKNIAFDQTHKAYNGMNKIRMQKSGVKAFQWIHSGGGLHPRILHQSMSGNVYTFDKLPIIDERTGERGIPGQAINCRCTMVPVTPRDDDDSDGAGPDGEDGNDSERLGPQDVK